MPILRQMPEIYLRGSLANITMANINENDRAELDNIVKYVANHPEMAKHRAQIIKQFSVTIGGDYSSDHSAGESDYLIAIWRGAVNLLHHRDYAFECTICESRTYKTKRGKPKSIDRRSIYCPNCNKTIMDGKPIDYSEYRKSLLEADLSKPCSPINAIEGDKKYNNADEILSDPKQLKKFFGEFAWNYFRQQLLENKRQEHKKSPQLISGRPCYVIAEELTSVCVNMGIYFNKAQIEDGYSYHIMLMQTPPEFSIELSRIRDKASQNHVSIICEDNNIIIKPCDIYEIVSQKINEICSRLNVKYFSNLGTFTLPFDEELSEEVNELKNQAEIDVQDDRIIIRVISKTPDEIEALVMKPEHVSFMDNQQCIADEDNNSTLDQVYYKFVEGQKMLMEDHITMVEMNDVISTIRNSLPFGLCRNVYDILCQSGDIYNDFSDKFGNGDPRINHIAEYLGITTRVVNDHRERIKVVCLSHGLSP